MIEGQWLAWYIFGRPSEHPVCIQFLTEMHEGTCQVRLKSGLRIIVPKKLVEHFTMVDDPQWPIVERAHLPENERSSVDGGRNAGDGMELARAASNALAALAFEQNKAMYAERWRE
jgi:hypothetical protein